MTELARETSSGKVLVVDDDDNVRSAIARCLSKSGFSVTEAAHPASALLALESGGFETVVSDISLPGFDGIELLRRVRSTDLDLPVVLVTGSPSLESAIQAVQHGAFRYATKPIDWHALQLTVRQAVAMNTLARVRRQLLRPSGNSSLQIGDRSGLEARFGSALDQLHLVFQPIVSWSEQRVYAYEALMRSLEPSLPHPGALLDAGERLGRLLDLSRVVRRQAHAACSQLPNDTFLFVNLHPNDLDDPTISDAGAAEIAGGKIVYEITERARLEQVKAPRARVERLRELGYRIAIDDLGAGYAGLTTLASLEPEIVKLDMELVRGIDASPVRQQLVGSMVHLCKTMGMQVIAEGVETEAERDTLVAQGCNLLQGYLFARPARQFVQLFA